MMKETVLAGIRPHTTASAPYATGMIGIFSVDQVSNGDNDVVCGGDGVIACSHAVVGAVVSAQHAQFLSLEETHDSDPGWFSVVVSLWMDHTPHKI